MWDIKEPDHFMFPQLHVEIGLVSNVLENFYDFVEEQVEAATPEQKVTQNNVIIATRPLERAQEQLTQWKQHEPRDLAAYRARQQQINAQLRRIETVDLLLEKVCFGAMIRFNGSAKERAGEISANQKKEVSSKKASLKEACQKKEWIHMPSHVEIKLLLSEYNISAAAYHGGKLNRVDCWRIMYYATDIFSEIQQILLQSQNPDRFSDHIIQQESDLHREILIVLDTICSRLRKKTGEPTQDD